jgi:hypothetical protein
MIARDGRTVWVLDESLVVQDLARHGRADRALPARLDELALVGHRSWRRHAAGARLGCVARPVQVQSQETGALSGNLRGACFGLSRYVYGASQRFSVGRPASAIPCRRLTIATRELWKLDPPEARRLVLVRCGSRKVDGADACSRAEARVRVTRLTSPDRHHQRTNRTAHLSPRTAVFLCSAATSRHNGFECGTAMHVRDHLARRSTR